MMLSKTSIGEDAYSASPAASINRPGSLHTAHGHGASLRADLARHDRARKLDPLRCHLAGKDYESLDLSTRRNFDVDNLERLD
jgi:hypothetical protein